MDYLEKAARVLDIEIFELNRLRERLGENFSRAVELIKEAVDTRGKVVVVGVGKSGHIGAKIAATLTSTGSPAVVLDSSNALHGDLGMIADGDVVLALSASGEPWHDRRWRCRARAKREWRDGGIAPDPARDCPVPSQDHRHVRRSEIHARTKCASVSRCKYRTGSMPAESGADVEHNGDAGIGRRAGDGAARGARF